MDLSILASNQPVLPPPPGEVTDFDHPIDEYRDMVFKVTLGVFFSVSSICALLRLWTRAVVVKQLGWDDYLALGAFILNIAFTAAVIELVEFGLTGIDWNIRSDWLIYYEPSYNYWNGTGWVIFCFIYGLVKLSILVLYLRVLGQTHRKFRITVYGMMVIIVGMTFGLVGDFLSWCKPVAKVFHDELPGTCVFESNLFFAQAILAVVTDFMVLLPPIPFIWQTSWDRSRKIGFLALIAFALCVTAIAFFRTVVYAPGVWRYEYEMYDQYYQTYFYMLEINGAIMAISLPVIAQLFRRVRWNLAPSHEPAGNVRLARHPDGEWSDPSSGGESAAKRPNSKTKKKRSPISQVIYVLASGLDRSEARSEARTDLHTDHEKAMTEIDSTGNGSDPQLASEGVVWQGIGEQEGLHTIRGKRYER